MVAVMAFPFIVFPHPGANDAIGLADAEWPLVLLEIVGAVAAYVVFRGQRGAMVRAALGVFGLGAGVSLVVGLFVFGSLSNDRYGPLLVFPPIIGLVGLIGIVVAVAAGSRHRLQLIRGAYYGAALAFGFGGWTLVRGSRAWLYAPYGFDLFLLVLVFGVGLVYLAPNPVVSRPAPPG
jgi:hypothetical protein